MGFYDLTVPTPDGKEFSLSEFRGKVVLVVNTATGCGFTPQYKDIEEMYEKYCDKGFEVLDVPCNQFHNQTPGSDAEIRDFCTVQYHTRFPQMRKSDVNGANELPLFTFLKKEKGFEGFGSGVKALAMNTLLRSIDKDFKNNPDVKWNFTKFIVDREGRVVARFEPTAPMKDVEALVASLL